jgi:hypothetical protein
LRFSNCGLPRIRADVFMPLNYIYTAKREDKTEIRKGGFVFLYNLLAFIKFLCFFAGFSVTLLAEAGVRSASVLSFLTEIKTNLQPLFDGYVQNFTKKNKRSKKMTGRILDETHPLSRLCNLRKA